MAWIIQDNYIFNDEFIPTNSAAENFLKDDAPLSCWRVDSTHDVAYNPQMGCELNPEASAEIFKGDSPDTMWRIDTTYETNNGNPYQKLMIGMPSQPPAPMYIQPSRPLIHVYGSRETNFNGNGYAIIEPISCTVYQEVNGAYEAKFQTYCDKYNKFTYLKKEALVKIPMRYHGEIIYQIFRVFKCNRIMDNYGTYRITATARHYFYELASRMIQDCRPTTLSGSSALTWIFEHGWYGGNTDTGFLFSSDIGNIRTAYYQNCTVVAALLGVDQCFVNRWGGRLYRDNNYFSINTVMEGSKRSGIIMYSYNMTDIDFEEDDSDLITVLNAEDNYGHSVTITNPDVPSEEIPHHIYGYIKLNYDADDETAFLADAQEYYDEHKQSRVNITVHFANLSDIKKYQQFLDLDDYEVGDKVMIYHKELDIYYSNLEIISKTYDVVAQKTAEIQVGSFKHAITRK